MIDRDLLIVGAIYSGLQNRNVAWEHDVMVWRGEYFERVADLNGPWPGAPSPYDYYDPDSRYASFKPLALQEDITLLAEEMEWEDGDEYQEPYRVGRQDMTFMDETRTRNIGLTAAGAVAVLEKMLQNKVSVVVENDWGSKIQKRWAVEIGSAEGFADDIPTAVLEAALAWLREGE